MGKKLRKVLAGERAWNAIEIGGLVATYLGLIWKWPDAISEIIDGRCFFLTYREWIASGLVLTIVGIGIWHRIGKKEEKLSLEKARLESENKGLKEGIDSLKVDNKSLENQKDELSVAVTKYDSVIKLLEANVKDLESKLVKSKDNDKNLLSEMAKMTEEIKNHFDKSQMAVASDLDSKFTRIMTEIDVNTESTKTEIKKSFKDIQEQLKAVDFEGVENAAVKDTIENILNQDSIIKSVQLYKLHQSSDDNLCNYEVEPTQYIARKNHFSINSAYEYYSFKPYIRRMYMKFVDDYNMAKENIEDAAKVVLSFSKELESLTVASGSDDQLVVETLKQVCALRLQNMADSPRPIEYNAELAFAKKNGFLLAIFLGNWVKYLHKEQVNNAKGNRIYLSRPIELYGSRYIMVVTCQDSVLNIRDEKFNKINSKIDGILNSANCRTNIFHTSQGKQEEQYNGTEF